MGRVKDKSYLNMMTRMKDDRDKDPGTDEHTAATTDFQWKILKDMPALREQLNEERAEENKASELLKKQKQDLERAAAKKKARQERARAPKEPQVAARSSSLRIAQKQSLVTAGPDDNAAAPSIDPPVRRASKRKADALNVDDNAITVDVPAKKPCPPKPAAKPAAKVKDGHIPKPVKKELAKKPASTKAAVQGKDSNTATNTAPTKKPSAVKVSTKDAVVNAPTSTTTAPAKKPTRATSVPNISKASTAYPPIHPPKKVLSGIKVPTKGANSGPAKKISRSASVPKLGDTSTASTTAAAAKKPTRAKSVSSNKSAQAAIGFTAAPAKRITRGNSTATGMDCDTLSAMMNSPAKRSTRVKAAVVSNTEYEDEIEGSTEHSVEDDIDPPRYKNGKFKKARKDKEDKAFDPHGGGKGLSRQKKKAVMRKQQQTKQKSSKRCDVDTAKKAEEVDHGDEIEDAEESENEQESAAKEEDAAKSNGANFEVEEFSDPYLHLPVDDTAEADFAAQAYHEDDFSNASAIPSSRQFDISLPSATEDAIVDRPMARYVKTKNRLTLELDLSAADTQSHGFNSSVQQQQDLAVMKARLALAVSIAEKRVANIQHQRNPDVIHGMLPKVYPMDTQPKKLRTLLCHPGHENRQVTSSVRDEPVPTRIAPVYATPYGPIAASAHAGFGVGERVEVHSAHDNPSGAGYLSAEDEFITTDVAPVYKTPYGLIPSSTQHKSVVVDDRPFGGRGRSTRGQSSIASAYKSPYGFATSSARDEPMNREYASTHTNSYDHSSVRNEPVHGNFASMHDAPVNHGSRSVNNSSRDYRSSYIPNLIYPDPTPLQVTVGLLGATSSGASMGDYRPNQAPNKGTAQNDEAMTAYTSPYGPPTGNNDEKAAKGQYQSPYGSGN